MRISDWSSDVCSSDLGRIVKPRLSTTYSSCFVRDLVFFTEIGSSSRIPLYSLIIRCPFNDTAPYKKCLVSSLNTVPISNRERSEAHTSELQSLMRISYTVF